MGFDGYQLKVNGGAKKKFSTLGVKEATVTLSNMMGDVLVFEVACTLATGPAAGLPVLGDTVRLYDARGFCRFIGRCETPAPKISTSEQKIVYTVLGPSSLLGNLPYRQDWNFPEEEPDDYVGPSTPMDPTPVGLVILFRDGQAVGSKSVSLRAQLEAVLDQAVEQAADEGWTIDYDLDGVPGTGNTFNDTREVYPPEDERRDLSCMDVVESCFRWALYVSCRWDYFSGNPVLKFSAAPSMETAGALAEIGTPITRVHGSGFFTRVVDVSQLTACEPVPLSQRLVKTLRIHYLITNITTTGDGRRVVWHMHDTDESTLDNGGFGTKEITIKLRGVEFDGTNYSEPEERPPDGLARVMHQAFGRVWWSYGMQFKGADVNWNYKVGEGWRVTGLGTGVGESSVAQQIVHDLRWGTTTIRTGAPGHLGYEDLSALLLANRHRNVPRSAGEQQYGFSKPDHDATDLDKYTALEVDIPTAGQDNIYEIKAQFKRTV